MINVAKETNPPMVPMAVNFWRKTPIFLFGGFLYFISCSVISVFGGYTTLVNLEDPFASVEGRTAPNLPMIKPGKAKVPSLASAKATKPRTLPKALEGTPSSQKETRAHRHVFLQKWKRRNRMIVLRRGFEKVIPYTPRNNKMISIINLI